MPIWGAALLSGALFFAGLAGSLVARDGARRAVAGMLMLNAAVLLCVAAARDLGRVDGQVAAFVIVGLLAVLGALGSRAARQP